MYYHFCCFKMIRLYNIGVAAPSQFISDHQDFVTCLGSRMLAFKASPLKPRKGDKPQYHCYLAILRSVPGTKGFTFSGSHCFNPTINSKDLIKGIPKICYDYTQVRRNVFPVHHPQKLPTKLSKNQDSCSEFHQKYFRGLLVVLVDAWAERNQSWKNLAKGGWGYVPDTSQQKQSEVRGAARKPNIITDHHIVLVDSGVI